MAEKKEVRNNINNGRIPSKYFLPIFILVSLTIFGVTGYFITSWVNKSVEVGTVGGEKVHKNYYIYYMYETKGEIEKENGLESDEDKASFWSDKENIDGAKEIALQKMQRYVVVNDKAKEERVSATHDQETSLEIDYRDKYREYGMNVDSEYYTKTYGISFDAYKVVMKTIFQNENYKALIMEKEGIDEDKFEENIQKEMDSGAYDLVLNDKVYNSIQFDW